MTALATPPSTILESPYFKTFTEGEVFEIGAGETTIILCNELKNCTIRLKEDARLTFVFLGEGGWEQTVRVRFELAGRGAEAHFLGLIIGKNDERYPFETFSRHLVPQTKAHYYLRAAMFDRSIVDYKGNIVIDKAAQLTDSYLAHHTLLLSDHARARTIPALEIEADDVKAGHAATIGKADEEVMFYLKSRGIKEADAELMLIEGFFEKELAMIESEEIRKQVREFLLTRLNTSIL